MPQYDLQIHRSAERELNSLKDTDKERLTDTLTDVAECKKPTDHPAVKPLEGQSGLFRVRVNNIRAICELEKPAVNVLRVGYRKHVYDGIDEITKERAATPS